MPFLSISAFARHCADKDVNYVIYSNHPLLVHPGLSKFHLSHEILALRLFSWLHHPHPPHQQPPPPPPPLYNKMPTYYGCFGLSWKKEILFLGEVALETEGEVVLLGWEEDGGLRCEEGLAEAREELFSSPLAVIFGDLGCVVLGPPNRKFWKLSESCCKISSCKVIE